MSAANAINTEAIYWHAAINAAKARYRTRVLEHRLILLAFGARDPFECAHEMSALDAVFIGDVIDHLLSNCSELFACGIGHCKNAGPKRCCLPGFQNVGISLVLLHRILHKFE
ncbi:MULTISPECIES: hypothetical protein [Rhizobium]|uniref:Uncharacterized protein n=1 Tax=Rhizobium indicum TaxID=2583231 RepID=A0ABX6PQV5_9HYPH|nr:MULTISPECIES: hypothetical protein [Rhizobium]NEI63870.1 hypothetical protein [Rhizobium leguminosarum]NKL19298.1 hypothetical protein [Rhizobium leguminosarum bv. viciae]NKL38232.1 hypothetical protein [Rhizobium leguminosarum bv. viciae]NKL57726.1 hypothetical protein [Rhizobium leguminosarum bv. viciae]QKK21055.1 hypothetical protein FFM53_031995 [Rhizobium indicum]